MNTRFVIPEPPAALDFKVLAMQRVKVQRGWNFERVISPFSHLWYLVAGQATIKHHGFTFELRPGCSHLITPYTLHDCHGEDFLDCFQLHFLTHLPGGTELFSVMDCDWRVAESPEFKQLLERLWSICLGHDPAAAAGIPRGNRSRTMVLTQHTSGIPLAQSAEAQSILRQLMQHFLVRTPWGQGRQTAVAASFPAVHEFINRHLAEPIMLADLARVAGLHPNYFSDCFQRQMGIRPLEYLMRLRMDRARYLLRTSKASIKEVTYDIGLRDPAYFSRVFLKYCHVSPSTYRTTGNA